MPVYLDFSPKDLYYYTVTTFEYINSTKNTTAGLDTSNPPTPANNWTPITSSAKQVQINSAIRFEVRVYRKSDNKLMGDSDGVKVLIWDSFKTANKDVATFTGVNSTDQSYANQLFLNNTLFSFNLQPTGKAGTVTITEPNVQVYFNQGSVPQTETVAREVHLKAGTSWPVITFTAATTTPNLPQAVILAIGGAPAANIKGQSYDPVTKVWTIIKESSSGAATVYQVDNSGKIIGQTTYKTVTAATIAANALKAKSTSKVSTVAPPGTQQGGGTNVAVITTEPSYGSNRWNPPPHKKARSSQLMDVIETNSYTIDPTKGATDYIITDYNKLVTGRMLQEKYAVSQMNKPVGGKPLPWGFRFMYNPNTIQYNNTPNTNIDWIAYSKDPTGTLSGNLSVSVELYLNRILDLRDLQVGTSPTAFGPIDTTKIYPTPINEEQITGIRTRGTEYDLEYLYRVVNGDPVANLPLLDSSLNTKTSDFGYITGTPFWLILNNNLKYFVGLSTMDVRHIIFTRSMIPVLSIVNLTFTRYPALDPAGEKIQSAIKNITGTTNQP
jgi:hypothetical protein